MTAQIVTATAPEVEDSGIDEFEALEPITDEDGSEPPELSIEELEALFSELN